MTTIARVLFCFQGTGFSCSLSVLEARELLRQLAATKGEVCLAVCFVLEGRVGLCGRKAENVVLYLGTKALMSASEQMPPKKMELLVLWDRRGSGGRRKGPLKSLFWCFDVSFACRKEGKWAKPLLKRP